MRLAGLAALRPVCQSPRGRRADAWEHANTPMHDTTPWLFSSATMPASPANRVSRSRLPSVTANVGRHCPPGTTQRRDRSRSPVRPLQFVFGRSWTGSAPDGHRLDLLTPKIDPMQTAPRSSRAHAFASVRLAIQVDIRITPILQGPKAGLHATAEWRQTVFHLWRNLGVDLARDQSILFQLT